jgi:hypothetical protein
MLVEDYFRETRGFDTPLSFISKGGVRPKDDRYAALGIPGDPVYAVYAEKQGGGPATKHPRPTIDGQSADRTEKERKYQMDKIKQMLECPYCGEKMKKWAVPQGPFTEWDNEYMYICFNDGCPYLVRGWEVMNRQGNRGISYRCMYYPEKEVCLPVPIYSLQALRESIVEE